VEEGHRAQDEDQVGSTMERPSAEVRAALVARLRRLRAEEGLGREHVRECAQALGVGERTAWWWPAAADPPPKRRPARKRARFVLGPAGREAFAFYRGNVAAVVRARAAVTSVEDLAAILDRDPDRVEHALEQAEHGAHSGTHVLRRATSGHYTVTARMDLLDPDAMDRLVAAHPTDDERSPYHYRHGRRHDIDPIEAQAIAAIITESENPQPVFVVDDYTRANLITAGWLACHPPEIEGDEVNAK